IDFPNGTVAVNRQPDDRELVEVDLGNDGRIDVVGQPIHRGGDGVLYVLHGGVNVAAQAKENRGDGHAFEALRLDVVDSFHAGTRVLDEVRDVEIHRLRGGLLAVGGDADDREVDLGELADAHVAVAEVAEDDHRRREHHGEHRVFDAQVGEGHGWVQPI